MERILVGDALGVGQPDAAQHLDARALALLLVEAQVSWQGSPRPAGRWEAPGSARSPGPGRSSRSRCRAGGAARRQPGSSMSCCSNRILPEVTLPGNGSSRRIESASVVLPEPLSPTTATISPGCSSERGAIDGPHRPFARGELHAEILNLKDRLTHTGLHFTESIVRRLVREDCGPPVQIPASTGVRRIAGQSVSQAAAMTARAACRPDHNAPWIKPGQGEAWSPAKETRPTGAATCGSSAAMSPGRDQE